MKTITETLNLVPQDKDFLIADWPAPANVKTLITTRNGGVSQGVYQSLNLGSHVGDNPDAVQRNREIVQEQVGLPVAYLNQIHSTIVVNAVEALGNTPDADAAVDNTGKAACAAMTADCLPVLFCDKAGTVVAAAHRRLARFGGRRIAKHHSRDECRTRRNHGISRPCHWRGRV